VSPRPKKFEFLSCNSCRRPWNSLLAAERKRRAKQLLALDGKQTMIQQTVSRLLPLAPAKRFWIITNEDSRAELSRQIPRLSKQQIIAEPVGRNTAPAIGLAAFILAESDPEAVIGMFPSDHVVGDEISYRRFCGRASNRGGGRKYCGAGNPTHAT